MSRPCSFARAEEARQAGWMSRRHQNPSSRDASIMAHAKKQYDELPEEWRELELPVNVRMVAPRLKKRPVKTPIREEKKPEEPKTS